MDPLGCYIVVKFTQRGSGSVCTLPQVLLLQVVEHKEDSLPQAPCVKYSFDATQIILLFCVDTPISFCLRFKS